MSMFTALRHTTLGFLGDRIVFRAAPTVDFDDDESRDAETEGATVFSGRCRITPSSGGRVVDAGEGVVSLRLFDVDLPWTATGVHVDQVGTVTKSTDPHLVGRKLRVVDVQGATDNPLRRVVCEDTLTTDIEEV